MEFPFGGPGLHRRKVVCKDLDADGTSDLRSVGSASLTILHCHFSFSS